MSDETVRMERHPTDDLPAFALGALDAAEARGALVIPPQGSPYLVLRLPAPPSGKTWEAWVLRGQAAIPAGTADANGVFTVVLSAPFAPGDGAAVSLENAPGVDKPTKVVLAVQKT